MQLLVDNEKILKDIIETIDIPDSAYEKAINRYKDLGNWLSRVGSTVSSANPHISSQGSFRLGTVIRPLNSAEEYDLDVTCTLTDNYSKLNISQKYLKELIGKELESYRNSRSIDTPLDDKHRCWRLQYKDELSFHMDIVPSIPENLDNKNVLLQKMLSSLQEPILASEIASLAIAITDNRHGSYDSITNDWLISNPKGYAKWFESRIYYGDEGRVLLQKAQVDVIPLFKRKAVLQKCIQLLKRHRDNMFKYDPDVKPISIIITTLAARAYSGEQELVSALSQIIISMEQHIRPEIPRVPNPVNPDEDFADRWSMSKYESLRLEDNFRRWLAQVRSDFSLLFPGDTSGSNVQKLHKSLGLSHTVEAATPKQQVYVTSPPKPWYYDPY